MADQKQPQKPAQTDVDFEKQEAALTARAAKFREKYRQPGNDKHITNEDVNIYSDGVRMSATIWRPENVPQEKLLPTIVLCHGWGGKKAHLDFSYAPKFAESGFIAVTFDYRTWGSSDGILVAAQEEPKITSANKNSPVTMKVNVVRKVIDPEWQLRDVDSVLNYTMGIRGVDTNRIGIWGSSFGAGHALAIGARDIRVKAIVCQIGSIDTHTNWVNKHPDYRGVPAIQQLAIEQSRGNVFPWTVKNPAGYDGSPNLPKVVFEHTTNTLSAVERIRAPTLLLAAEKEDLFKNENNSEVVYRLLKGKVPCELGYLPGTHYDAYDQPAYGQGVQRAIDWFKTYLSIPDPKL